MRGSCGGHIGNTVYRGRCYEPSGPYTSKVRAGTKSLLPCPQFCSWHSWMGSQDVDGVRTVWGTLKLHLCFFADEVVLLASSDCDLQHALGFCDLQPSVKQLSWDSAPPPNAVMLLELLRPCDLVVLFTSDGLVQRWQCCGRCKALHFPVHLCSNPKVSTWALSSD